MPHRPPMAAAASPDTPRRAGTMRRAAASAVAAAVAAMGLPGGAGAQTAAAAGGAADAGSVGPARDILVIGRGLAPPPADPAYDSQVIAGDALTTAPGDRLEDVLGGVAGFQQFRRSDSSAANPSAQGATLRGLGGNAASRTLVTLDGVPMADPMFGSVPYAALVPDRLAAIRVTRGGGSGAFGAGAVSGTIALESAGPDTLGPLTAALVGNDRGETALSATAAPRLGAGFAVLTARWDRGEGFWTTPAAQRVPASARAAYDSWSVGARAVAPLSADVDVQARTLVFGDRRTLRFVGANSASSGADASLRVIGHGPWRFDLLGYAQMRGFSNLVISATSYRATLNQRATPSTGLGAKVEVRPPLGERHVLRLGADWRSARGDLSEIAISAATGAPTGQRRAGGRNGDIGLFADETWALRGAAGAARAAGALLLTGGLRADRWTIADGTIRTATAAGVALSDAVYPSRAGWATTARGGLLWQASRGIALRGSAYTGFRQPTLNELYRTYVVFPVTTTANPALINEHLTGAEAGLDLTPAAGLRLGVTVFDNRLAHAIANVTVARNLQLRENVAAIRARGVEIDGAARRGRLTLAGSLAWSDPRVEAPGTTLDRLRPAQTPRFSASASATWHPRLLGREGWLLAADVRREGARFEDDLDSSVLPAATTLGAVAEAPLARGATLILRGQNLADATVETRNQAGSIDIGPPRTVWFGVRVGF